MVMFADLLHAYKSDLRVFFFFQLYKIFCKRADDLFIVLKPGAQRNDVRAGFTYKSVPEMFAMSLGTSDDGVFLKVILQPSRKQSNEFATVFAEGVCANGTG